MQAVRAGRSLTEVLARAARPSCAPACRRCRSTRCAGWAAPPRCAQHLAPKTPPPEVDALLVTALALLWPGDTPPYADHTLVDQAVSAARQRTPAAAGFINAVLRRFLREREAWSPPPQHSPLGAYNHPLWWIERLKRDWPAQWQALLAQANRHPPMTLRVNARRGTAPPTCTAWPRRAAAALLDDAGAAAARRWCWTQPCPVHAAAGLRRGRGLGAGRRGAARRAAAAGAPRALTPGARVLDACAAPGGKTAHLLELADLDLLALDSDPQRLARVQDNAEPPAPAGRAARRRARASPQRWWDGRPFDAILLDAPCTASGIVRRHPDVRWLRRPDDITALARMQAEMLDALWPLLAPGGRLLYATCSVFQAEGRQQIDAFLQRLAPGTARAGPAVAGPPAAAARQCQRPVTGRSAGCRTASSTPCCTRPDRSSRPALCTAAVRRHPCGARPRRAAWPRGSAPVALVLLLALCAGAWRRSRRARRRSSSRA